MFPVGLCLGASGCFESAKGIWWNSAPNVVWILKIIFIIWCSVMAALDIFKQGMVGYGKLSSGCKETGFPRRPRVQGRARKPRGGRDLFCPSLSRSIYWDYAMTIRLEEIVYLHCHQQGKVAASLPVPLRPFLPPASSGSVPLRVSSVQLVHGRCGSPALSGGLRGSAQPFGKGLDLAGGVMGQPRSRATGVLPSSPKSTV